MYSALRSLVVILAVSPFLPGQKACAEKTLRGKLKVEKVQNTEKSHQLVFDTVTVVSQSDIRLSGYDKPLNSRKESLFVSNRTEREITAVEIRITYKDMQQRMLHETEKLLRTDIPPGETRRVEFPSWDRQNSFYYYKGRQPRVGNVTPYRVDCSVIRYVSTSVASDGAKAINHKQTIQ